MRTFTVNDFDSQESYEAYLEAVRKAGVVNEYIQRGFVVVYGNERTIKPLQTQTIDLYGNFLPTITYIHNDLAWERLLGQYSKKFTKENVERVFDKLKIFDPKDAIPIS